MYLYENYLRNGVGPECLFLARLFLPHIAPQKSLHGVLLHTGKSNLNKSAIQIFIFINLQYKSLLKTLTYIYTSEH